MFDSGFSTTSTERQLFPRKWAARILDSARAGDAVSQHNIELALKITGDIAPKFDTMRLDHDTRPTDLSTPSHRD